MRGGDPENQRNVLFCLHRRASQKGWFVAPLARRREEPLREAVQGRRSPSRLDSPVNPQDDVHFDRPGNPLPHRIRWVNRLDPGDEMANGKRCRPRPERFLSRRYANGGIRVGINFDGAGLVFRIKRRSPPLEWTPYPQSPPEPRAPLGVQISNSPAQLRVVAGSLRDERKSRAAAPLAGESSWLAEPPAEFGILARAGLLWEGLPRSRAHLAGRLTPSCPASSEFPAFPASPTCSHFESSLQRARAVWSRERSRIHPAKLP